MSELKAVAVGWAIQGGKTLKDKPEMWRVYGAVKEHLIWKIGSVFTIDGARDGRAEFDSLDGAVASLQAKAS